MTVAQSQPMTGTIRRSRTSEHRLRLVLAANAITSGVGGIAGFAAAGWWSTELGVDNVTLVRIVSAALVVFAVDVALAAARGSRILDRATLAISAADVVWVLASLVIVAAGWLSGFGTVVALVLAVGVADFAIAQLWLRRRL